MKSGELKQYTDSLGGNVNPIVLKDAKGTKVAFISYYKGQYGLHTMDLTKPLKAAATADFGAPGPVIDFQAPLTHTLVAQNVRKKKSWEKLFLEGRPSIAVGVTNNADFYGGTETRVQRRARRPPRQPDDRRHHAVHDLRRVVHGHLEAVPVGRAGDLPEAVLLREQPLLLRPAAQPPGEPRHGRGHAHGRGRQRLRDLPARRLPAARADGRLLPPERLRTTTRSSPTWREPTRARARSTTAGS